jgi:transposase-like protein
MRKFKCFDCGNTWQMIFGEGDPGFKQVCPKCKSLNIHRKTKYEEGVDLVREYH